MYAYGAATGYNGIFDFLHVSDPTCGGVSAPANCYLSQFYPGGNPPRMADYNQSPQANRHDTGFYLQDQFQATDKLKINIGARVDNANFDYTTNTAAGAFNDPNGSGYSSGLFLPISTGFYTSGPLATACGGAACPNPALDKYASDLHRTSSTIQPRFGFAFQFNPRNSVTFNYGRSVELPPIAFVDDRIPRSQYNAFNGVPADFTAFNPASAGLLPPRSAGICGPTGDRVVPRLCRPGLLGQPERPRRRADRARQTQHVQQLRHVAAARLRLGPLGQADAVLPPRLRRARPVLGPAARQRRSAVRHQRQPADGPEPDLEPGHLVHDGRRVLHDQDRRRTASREASRSPTSTSSRT